jgi:peptidoglycan/xylan/chitin deacetylase (PgdA/CDA1 family)
VNKDNPKTTKRKRNRIRKIKNAILVILVIFWFIPMVLSVLLAIRVVYLERKVEQYMLSKQKSSSSGLSDVIKAETKKAYEPQLQNTEPADEKKIVYLTFEDGPSQNTEKILDILKTEKVKATFFVIGHEEDKFSQRMYRRIVKEGHTLGLHSYSHFYDEIYKTPDAFEKDFMKLRKYLYRITGVKSMYYRFPGGSSSTALQYPITEYVIRLTSKGIEYLDWNVVCGDNIGPNRISKDEWIRSALNGIEKYSTSIVQMYDSSNAKTTGKALKQFIQKCKDKKYELLPIDKEAKLIQHAQ